MNVEQTHFDRSCRKFQSESCKLAVIPRTTKLGAGPGRQDTIPMKLILSESALKDIPSCCRQKVALRKVSSNSGIKAVRKKQVLLCTGERVDAEPICKAFLPFTFVNVSIGPYTCTFTWQMQACPGIRSQVEGA